MGSGVMGNNSHLLDSSSSPSLGKSDTTSFEEANIISGSTQFSSPLVDTMALGNSTMFSQGFVADGTTPSSIICMNDPLQRLLQKSYPPSSGSASNNYIANDGNRVKNSDSNRNVIQRNSDNVIGNANQFLTLLQQRSDTRLPPAAKMTNSVPSTSMSTADFQLGNPSLGSKFDANKQMLQNLQNNSNQLIRNYQLIQHQAVRMPDFNMLVPSHLTNVPNQARRSTNDILSISMPISQILMPNEVIRSTDKDKKVTTRKDKFPFPTNGRSTDTNDAIQSATTSTLYDCDTGRSKLLYLPCDSQTLSEYQCLLRKQIELFEATEQDIKSSTKGRNKPIFLGQVGVRCIHCRNIKPEFRSRGATYYPATLGAMYQSGQTMAIRHLRYHCPYIPVPVRDRLFMLKDGKSSAGGGKKYWSDAASVMGVYLSDGGGLRFKPPPAAKAAAPSNKNGD